MRGGRRMTDLEWEDFMQYLDNYAIWRLDWVHVPPIQVDVDINAHLYCTLDSNLANVESLAEYNIRQRYGLRRGILGYPLIVSDTMDCLKLNYRGLKVDYIDTLTPQVDLIPQKTHFINLRNINITAEYSNRNYLPYSFPVTIGRGIHIHS